MNIFLKIPFNEYATVPYFSMKCRFSSAAYNVALVTLGICYFFDVLPFLPFLLYTDETSNASAFDSQLHTLSTDFSSEKEFLDKLFCSLLNAEIL